ncbi:MAG: CvpA family protein [Pseudomonadales bacterium]|jgi:membrane protein required for colicin V production
MATADIIILIIILLSSVIGLVRGLFRELLSLVVWFAAVMLALYFSAPVGDALSGQIADESVRTVLGFFIVFLTTLIAGGILQALVKRLVSSTGLTGTDRFLGFLFGSARGVLVCIVGLIALESFQIEAEWWQTSKFIPQLLAFEDDVLGFMGKARDAVVEATGEV